MKSGIAPDIRGLAWWVAKPVLLIAGMVGCVWLAVQALFWLAAVIYR